MTRTNDIKHIAISLFAVSAMVVGCAVEDDVDTYDERALEIVDNLVLAGYTEDDIEIVEEHGVLGVEGPLVVLQGDVDVTLEASREMAGLTDSSDVDFRQYANENLVSNTSATYCLARVTSAASGYGAYVLHSRTQTGVNYAKDNYNALSGFPLPMKVVNATITSSGTLSHNDSSCVHNTWIYRDPNLAGNGGASTAPSGGSPGGYVRIGAGLDSGESTNAHEHTVTHEVGHAIGMRHSDWQDRASCSSGGAEPSCLQGSSNCAEHISGTPSGSYTYSLFAACYDPYSTDGEFESTDVTALTTLY